MSRPSLAQPRREQLSRVLTCIAASIPALRWAASVAPHAGADKPSPRRRLSPAEVQRGWQISEPYTIESRSAHARGRPIAAESEVEVGKHAPGKLVVGCFGRWPQRAAAVPAAQAGPLARPCRRRQSKPGLRRTSSQQPSVVALAAFSQVRAEFKERGIVRINAAVDLPWGKGDLIQRTLVNSKAVTRRDVRRG